MVQFVKKTIDELFHFESSNAIYHAINVTVHGKRETNSFPYVVRSSVHNGIKGYIVEPKNGLNSGNTISLAQDTGEFFYQEKSYFTGNKVKVLMPIGFELTKCCALYLMTAMQKAFYAFTWGSSFNTDVMKKVEVVVPVTDSGQLDVQYMEQYIKRIEAQYIKRIEAYLSVLGYDSIDDCELSSQDLKVLSGPDEWGEFRIGSLFKKLSSRYLGSGNKFDAVRKKPSAEFSLPVTYAKYNNNGIMYWGRPADFQHYRNCISVIYNGAVSAGLVFAQKDDTGVLAESYLIDFKNYHNESFKVDLYISAVMKKALYPLYSRENLAVWSKVKDNMIKLPVTPDGKPDYDFMDQYITAIEKKKVLKLKQAMDHKLDLYREMSHQD